jgi:hypothetical protein
MNDSPDFDVLGSVDPTTYAVTGAAHCAAMAGRQAQALAARTAQEFVEVDSGKGAMRRTAPTA